jgi:hypothetical protein
MNIPVAEANNPSLNATSNPDLRRVGTTSGFGAVMRQKYEKKLLLLSPAAAACFS